MDDIFDIQERVAGKIVKALKLRLTPGEKKTLKRRSTKNTEAYQLYLQGRYFWNKRNKEGILRALKFFQEAIDSDPGYPQAWAGLADAYNLLSEHPGVSRRENYPKAKAAVARALELDPNLPEAQTSHASLTMMYEWDWATAEKEFRLAIYLNPNYATAHHWFAEWMMFMGRMDEAIRENLLAVELDPISPAILKDLGMKYYYARRYDETIAVAKKTLELDPGFVMANRLLALAYQATGRAEEAIEENRRWTAMTGNVVEGNLWIAHIHAASGRHAEARALLNQALGGPPLPANLYRAVALICAELGEIDDAFAWLAKGIDLRSESLCTIKVDPKMDKLRTDPRFAEIVRKIGLDR
jgi:tetratricopeptide (TPR) repeat protein